MSKRIKRTIFVAFIVLFIISIVAVVINNRSTPKFNIKDVDMVQMKPPKDGQEIAIIDTTEGTFKVALYRDYAPNTVARFVDLANKGYYNGKYIFSVQKNIYFLAGTTQSNGVVVKKDSPNFDTENIKTDNEYNKNLWPLKGSLMAFSADLKGNGIFFGGINTVEFTDDFKKQLKSTENANQDIINAFLEKGGIPNFSYQHTIFAQTYEGMDVFEKICNIPVKSDKDKTLSKEVKINSITISKYEATSEDSSNLS